MSSNIILRRAAGVVCLLLVTFVALSMNAAAPTATNLSAAETYTEDTPRNLVDIVVSDPDSAAVTVTLTLSSPSVGSLSTATAGATTSTFNAGTGVWTASGRVTELNTLLAGVTFIPAPNYNGSFTIATAVTDGVAAALTGSKSMTGIQLLPPVLLSPTVAGNQMKFTLTGTTGALYVIESSLALSPSNWTSISTGAAPFQFSEPTTNQIRFYRGKRVVP